MGRCKTHWRSERGDDFWKSVTQYGLYNYGEILGGPDDRSTGNEDIMKEYTDYISVTDSNYGKELRDSFNSGKAPTSSGNWSEKAFQTISFFIGVKAMIHGQTTKIGAFQMK